MAKLLPEICRIQYGYAFDSAKFSDSEGVPLIRIRDVVRGYSETYTTEKCGEEYIVNDGDMLIGMDGEFNIAHWKGGKAYLNQRVCRLIPSDEVDALYLYYFMPKALKAIEDKTPFVTVKHLSAKELNKVVVPMPSMHEQKKIASSLQKVDELIALRKEQLAKLDRLVKSRFVELFGSCGTYELLQDSNIYISDGNYSSKYPTADEFVEEGVPFIRSSNMEMNTIVDNNMYFITKEKHAILLKGHVKAGDVLITTRGATIGKIACVPPRHEDSNINAQIVLLRCPKNEYNPLFLSWYLKLDNTQVEIQKLISGSAQPQLPIKRLVQLKLLKPDINLQNQFAAFVEQTDKSKLAIQASLDKLELLKRSLMQEYFG